MSEARGVAANTTATSLSHEKVAALCLRSSQGGRGPPPPITTDRRLRSSLHKSDDRRRRRRRDLASFPPSPRPRGLSSPAAPA